MLGDPELKKLKKGDIIQLQRRGFFRVDVAYEPHSLHTTKETPVVLFYVPDGHTKENPSVSAAVKQPANKETTTTVSVHQRFFLFAPMTSFYLQTVTKSPEVLNEEITKQGELVRNLKAQKAAKADIDTAVKVLLALKSDYKSATGQEWKPGASVAKPTAASGVEELLKKIATQGDKVRDLKTKKAEKSVLDGEVKVLLQLKADYKALTGQDWKPGAVVPKSQPEKPAQVDDAEILSKIAAQGEKVRDLKAKKAEKSAIDEEVKVLLQLKADYKALTGQDWKPGAVPKQASASMAAGPAGDDPKKAELTEKVNAQGNLVRELKAKKASKVLFVVVVEIW